MFQRFDIHSRIVQRSGITFYGARDKLLGREMWLWRLLEFADAPAPDAAALNAGKAPLRALRHPAIVALHDIEADPDGLVALLDPAAGMPLDELMARGAVGIVAFIGIARPCLEALSAAAAAGVPHGALEPGLIFGSGSPDGAMSASVAGFGIAALVMRMQGAQHDCSEALDVWMLGGILHTLLTGVPVEEGHAVPPPHEVRPEVPEALSGWVMRLLVDDDALRPQTAAEALALLDEALAPPLPDTAPPAAEAHAQPPAHWPPGFDPRHHQPPMWQYPPVAVWHVPPPQWHHPHDPAIVQQQQMWQQVAWHPWHMPMQHDPYQQQFLQQQQMAAPPQQMEPAQQPAPAPVATPAAPANPGAPRPRTPAPPAIAAVAEQPDSPAAAEKKKSPARFIGPAISIAAALLVVWYFRGVFLSVFSQETLKKVFGDNVEVQWPAAAKQPSAAPAPPPAKEKAAAK